MSDFILSFLPRKHILHIFFPSLNPKYFTPQLAVHFFVPSTSFSTGCSKCSPCCMLVCVWDHLKIVTSSLKTLVETRPQSVLVYRQQRPYFSLAMTDAQLFPPFPCQSLTPCSLLYCCIHSSIKPFSTKHSQLTALATN